MTCWKLKSTHKGTLATAKTTMQQNPHNTLIVELDLRQAHMKRNMVHSKLKACYIVNSEKNFIFKGLTSILAINRHSSGFNSGAGHLE